MGTAEEDLTEPSALEECCYNPMFLRELKGLSKPTTTTTDMIYWVNGHVKKRKLPFTCCSVSILPYSALHMSIYHTTKST